LAVFFPSNSAILHCFFPKTRFIIPSARGLWCPSLRLADAIPATAQRLSFPSIHSQESCMPFEDKTIVCVDCGAQFTFTADEQQRFAERGFTNEPKRCKTCRDQRKAQQGGNRGAGGGAPRTGGFGSGGGGRSFSGGGGGGGAGRGFSSGPRQMFPATCASCGQQTEVPFKPTGSRPVYCRECFQSQRG
jgi:CxxC-x17-CxxC domain-containing protein